MQGSTTAEGMTQLILSAVDGDEIAFTHIVDAYHTDMVRVAFVVCGDRDLAEDAGQRAWAIAWRKLRDVRDPVRLRPWLFAVAANEARQLVRGRARRRIREIAMSEPGGFATGPIAEDIDPRQVDLVDALRRLSPGDRSLIALRYAAGLSSSEIGRAIGMSSGGVRARLQRLLRHLREELDEELDDA